MTSTGHGMRHLKLRYAGICRSCGVALERGTWERYERASRQVVCADCIDDGPAGRTDIGNVATQMTLPDDPIVPGTAGASARREHARRAARREAHIRERLR